MVADDAMLMMQCNPAAREIAAAVSGFGSAKARVTVCFNPVLSA